MTDRTGEHLRAELHRLAEQIGPQDIPRLTLPELGSRPSRQAPPWGTGRRAGTGRWLIPAAAATAVLALVIVLVMIGRTAPLIQASAPGPIPPYLVISNDGHGYILSTATGRVAATIRPPVPGFLISSIAVLPGSRGFYVAGQLPATRPRVKIEFFEYPLSPAGRPGQPRQLGAPVIEQVPALIQGLLPIPLAVSADGSQLAYAWPDPELSAYIPRSPATITVLDTTTGRSHAWSIWQALGTGISSLSFATGHRLAFVAAIQNAVVSGRIVVPHRDNRLNVFMILNTASRGSSLTASSTLITYGSEPLPPGTSTYETGPLSGLVSPDGHTAYLVLGDPDGSNRLAQVSVITGAVTATLTRPAIASETYPFSIEGQHMLVGYPPRHPNSPGGGTICADLASITLPGHRFIPLPAPPTCPTTNPDGSFQAAW